ncbi:acyltransferase [Sphaerisporangium krabiense]|uniref:Peptidoglycan/LPS O-acetylase OafA/YrhL n=1 Tax=Sphaerisporangium krabiense TaxID=763782 RepID=A0A7W9DQE6_9ACTN|nr:acyltransferase [Sphaerisporangium krabiense]MBB5626305.1 peptidoglycan/LPS O-acetylase OafA/YrhL [Sphaerisporangium krabiense]GII66030.1 acyltransferase [Sphaerisporangium krabiense]
MPVDGRIETSAPSVDSVSRSPSAPPIARQAWLDALRGLAALVVVFEHSLDALLPEVRGAVSPWFDFGQYGVLLFFLISGYVVPVSLERRASVRGFWITRFFRIYPLWAVAAAVGTAFAVAGVWNVIPGQTAERPWTALLAHLTMLQDLLQVPSVVNVFWTLSYEMAFYLLVTAMFVLGSRGAGAGTSLSFAACGLLAGLLIPAGWLTRNLGVAVVGVATVALLGGIAAVVSTDRNVRTRGAVVIAALALVLLTFNSRVGAWQSLVILATMFAGTAVYRLQHSEAPARTRWMLALVPVVSVAAAVLLGPGWGMSESAEQAFKWSWSAALIGAWLTFAAGLALRHRAVSRALVWLGLVSYSIYLLHPLILQVVRRLTMDPSQISLPARLAWEAALFALVLGLAALGHRFVERPAQRVGRRLARAVPRESAIHLEK